MRERIADSAIIAVHVILSYPPDGYLLKVGQGVSNGNMLVYGIYFQSSRI